MPDRKGCNKDKDLSPVAELVTQAEGCHEQDMVNATQVGNMVVTDAKI